MQKGRQQNLHMQKSRIYQEHADAEEKQKRLAPTATGFCVPLCKAPQIRNCYAYKILTILRRMSPVKNP